ncbi:glycosyl hydrolase family 18 protein [Hymenobacter sp. YC55]|uniref:glycosyl hydrolase family 18 protein n=1 Tax=Hymenobacter sp. YC55 TaxID=3034019 RepID=UPI0023F7F7D9|nr:glycosyl hydrolase family 18 protein [Hymenobacter sp. YC55]MDF7815651.1 glycosyl hydrolase family 18 protein [Hymenobacter sp. YC55]
MKRLLWLWLLVMGFCLQAKSVQAQFRVVGYLPAWRGDINPAQLAQLTHVNYAFVHPTATGGLEPLQNPDKLRRLVKAAHAAKVQVLVSVGGWHDGDHSAFDSIGANPALTSTFVATLVRFAQEYQLDGIDMDWEHPDARTASGYATLMQQLAAQLHPQGKLLTAAIAGGTWAGPGIASSVFESVDFMNIMSYDAPAPTHSTYADAVQTLAYWKERGLPVSKMVLGVPFYGQPGGVAFTALVAQGADPKADSLSGIGYNGLTTIKSKTNLALDQASGIMIWELSQDALGSNSLLSAISQEVQCRKPVKSQVRQPPK